ncbi:hypothetical protein F6Q07_02855 [Pectobacterium parmentieri]|uniref:Glycogen phosphorylase n=1 Tax=Pectobacterium parmentieri TaxID=1905730 RepID=A0ABS0RV19_PECPM|nr:hypothetical protein [Pectobacterium parmentieri]MBI0469736.1 hypothetical protein [Pectobacterium parmentieri]MBI0492206.1 hypothetical protein [Pectobacterium parmentieri]MBI0517078.1 hypothetical protein [Pectobacterium parmentieri]MBI0548954.1 hypothetical protein [Pectobacterium parmentieri]
MYCIIPIYPYNVKLRGGWLCRWTAANMGYFSSDRTIGEYAEDIWNIKPTRL